MSEPPSQSSALAPTRTNAIDTIESIPSLRPGSSAPAHPETPGFEDELSTFVGALETQSIVAPAELHLQVTWHSPERVVSFRSEFDGYVHECLQRCPPKQFLELADVWLSTYIDHGFLL